MLKLNASYSKKVPAEGEYSSQSYHASIEVELPDGLSQEQLNDKIHETFAMVRESVESELHGNAPQQTAQPQSYTQTVPSSAPSYNNNQQHGGGNSIPASPKQLNYLLSLASKRGISPQQLATQLNVSNLEQLTKRQCSDLINSWKAA